MDKTIGRASLQGWLIALLDTGYEKLQEWTTDAGNTVTVYQNKAEGKLVVLFTYGDTGQWVALYPQCGYWNDKQHLLAMDPATKWIEGTPDEVLAEVARLASERSRR